MTACYKPRAAGVYDNYFRTMLVQRLLDLLTPDRITRQIQYRFAFSPENKAGYLAHQLSDGSGAMLSANTC
ncbi:hypothetical protein D3C87_2076880 [compost metagenome]